MHPPPGTIARDAEWERLAGFAANEQGHATLGIVWGRRRVGKSFLLSYLSQATGGFYYEALRGSRAEALRDLGAQLAHFVGTPAPLDLPDWPTAVGALMRLAAERPLPVVLDEYPYLLEHSPELDSVLQRAFGPHSEQRLGTQCRFIVCGSAMSVMQGLLGRDAPLHGRAGLDLRVMSFGFRAARELHGVSDLRLATKLYAVIGGVAAYARDMVEDDLPVEQSDFDRWVAHRVVSPAAPLFREVDLLLTEDPATGAARKLNLYHATLAGVALGNQAYNRLTNYVKVSGPSLSPILQGLVDAGLLAQVEDPIRDNRPLYHPADPLVRFHYAITRAHHARFSRAGVDAEAVWRSLAGRFTAQVVGPCFEAMARDWVRDHAAAESIGGDPIHVGSTVLGAEGEHRELDVVVAGDDNEPSRRMVTALGEAKSGEQLTPRHLQRLEVCRAALGGRAADAKLLLFGAHMSQKLVDIAAQRSDVELIDLDRLYFGV